MMVQVKLFAAARQAVGEPAIEIELREPATVADLRAQLVDRYPALAPWQSHLLFAVDQQYAADTQALDAQAEVACFPPVSGG